MAETDNESISQTNESAVAAKSANPTSGTASQVASQVLDKRPVYGPGSDAVSCADFGCGNLGEAEGLVEVGGCRPNAVEADVATNPETDNATKEVCSSPHLNGPPSAVDPFQAQSDGMTDESGLEVTIQSKATACLDDTAGSEAMECFNLGLWHPVSCGDQRVRLLHEMSLPRRVFKGRTHKAAPIVASSPSPRFTLSTRSDGRLCLQGNEEMLDDE